MRQAGRILAPYRQLKEKTGSIQALFDDPELVTQITLMPVEMLEVDAAILFADIFTPVIPMGCDIVFAPGPTIGSPVRTQDDVVAAVGGAYVPQIYGAGTDNPRVVVIARLESWVQVGAWQLIWGFTFLMVCEQFVDRLNRFKRYGEP